MTEEQKKLFMDDLVPTKSLSSSILKRKNPYIFESISNKLIEDYKLNGWEIDREFRTKVRVKKQKPFDVAFEDEVWSTIANLGFNLLNNDRFLRIPNFDKHIISGSINIFAADKETILLIVCKSIDSEPIESNFYQLIQEIGGNKGDIIETLHTLFPESKHRIKCILATKNYFLSAQDSDCLENYGFIHFDEETIQYYQELTKHLGVSARFQLLGLLFDGQDIPELQNRVPAIEGKMGGHIYYSFSIEPDKLLKIGYVLHRNKANKKLMPTYQRLIKRTRLNAIQDFVDEGGFFPNSIIININTNGKKLSFDRANTQVEETISRIGILHLPKKYRSAFIIDGQHRLYGYANSEYKSTNTIPVVAFIDMDRKDQVRLFMQINENQKAVPKNLRNTLNSDLLWDSENRNEQIKALKLYIAQELGEDKISPLYDKIVVGENPKTLTRCITIDTIKIGLDRSNFFGQFQKNAIKQEGTFFKGDNDSTFDTLYPFLIGCFTYIKEEMPQEWAKGETDDGFLSINAGIENLIKVFNDIIDHLVSLGKIDPKTDQTNKIISEVKIYLSPLIDYFKKLTDEQKIELRKSYGTGGRTRYWRILQRSINKALPDFNPKGLAKYWNDEAKAFNEDSFKMIRDIETFMKADFKQKLEKSFGRNWFKQALPKAVYDEAMARAADKNYNAETSADEVEPWDCLNMIDYRKIGTNGRNWIEIFEKDYTKPGEEKISGGKEAKTSWMHKLERIRNQNFHSYSVKEDEYEFLCELYEWLIEKRVENDLT